MNPIFKLIVKLHIGMFRLTNGRLGSKFSGNKVLLLTTTGNKSGQPRTVPLMQFDYDGKRYIIGSFGGAPRDPAWIRNLQKTPEVGIEIRGEKYRARASLLDGEARDQIYSRVKEQMSNFADYEKKVGDVRKIPVVEITPLS